MAAVMIGVDPHKGSHTAVVIGAAEELLGQLRVRACAAQAERLLAWAEAWPERTWAIEGAGGLGHLLAQQLVAAGERVLDVPPKLARVRLLEAGDTNKNDPNDALSVAIGALRSRARREVAAEDYGAVLKAWSKRHRDLSRARNQVTCRLHAVLCDLVPGGFSKEISAGQAARVLEQVTPAGAIAQARHELAGQFLQDLRNRLFEVNRDGVSDWLPDVFSWRLRCVMGVLCPGCRQCGRACADLPGYGIRMPGGLRAWRAGSGSRRSRS